MFLSTTAVMEELSHRKLASTVNV